MRWSVTSTEPLALAADALVVPVCQVKEEADLKPLLALLAGPGRAGGKQALATLVRSGGFAAKAESLLALPLPETKAGIYAQADFGYMGRLWDSSTKKMRRAFAFIITLVFSRHMYAHITFSQDADAIIEGCEAAWVYFGGISKIVIVDNMTPVIDKPDRYTPKINSLFMEYSQYRGFIIDPANTGHAKGKPHVERMVPYVRRNFFLGEDFISKEDCQERAVEWCSHIAGTRIHGTTRKIPIEVFKTNFRFEVFVISSFLMDLIFLQISQLF